MAYTGNVVSGLPDWNPDISVIAEPPNDKKLTGWQPDEKPPAQWFNWLNAGFYKSIKEIDDMFNKTSGHGHTGVDGDAPKLDPTKAFTYAPVNKAGDTMTGDLVLKGHSVEIRRPDISTGGWARGYTIKDINDNRLVQFGTRGSVYNGVNTVYHHFIGRSSDDTFMKLYPDKRVTFDGNVEVNGGLHSTIPHTIGDQLGTVYPKGLSTDIASGDATYPLSHATIFNVKIDNSRFTQLLFGHGAAGNTDMRFRHFYVDTWSNWATVFTDKNHHKYTPVALDGSTPMTGQLEVNNWVSLKNDGDLVLEWSNISGVRQGYIGRLTSPANDSISIHNAISGKYLSLYDSGLMTYTGEEFRLENNKTSRKLYLFCNDGETNPRAWIEHYTDSDTDTHKLIFSSTFGAQIGRADFEFLYGKVGIQKSEPAYPLDVNGIIRADGLRSIQLDPGIGYTKIKGAAGGWATGYFFEGSDGAFLGGFGAHGGTDVLNYYYIGTDYDNSLVKFTPDGVVETNLGKLVLRYHHIENHYTDDTGRIVINYRGYQGGTSHFRDFLVYNGKMETIANFVGSEKSVKFYGSVEVVDGLTVRGASSFSSSGGAALSLLPGGSDHTYLQFFPRSAEPDSRGGFIGFGSVGTTTMTVKNEKGDIELLTSNGNVGIRKPEPVYSLDVGGQIRSYSELADKEDMLILHKGIAWSSALNKHQSIVWQNPLGDMAAIGARYDGSSVSIDFHSLHHGGYKTNSDISFSVFGSGERPIFVDSTTGKVSIGVSSVGGWATKYCFERLGGVSLGGFGAHGTGDALHYYYIGTEYNNPLLKIQPDGMIKTKGDRIAFRIDSIEDHGTNGLGRISMNYYGYQGGTTHFRDFRVYDGKAGLIAHFDGETKEADFNGRGVFSRGGNAVVLKAGVGDHAYIEYYPRTAALNARGGYMGFGTAGTTIMKIENEIGDIELSPNGGVVNVDGELSTTGAIRSDGDKVPVMKKVAEGTGTINSFLSPLEIELNVTGDGHHILVFDVYCTTLSSPIFFGCEVGRHCAYIETHSSPSIISRKLFIHNPSSNMATHKFVVYEMVI